MCIKVLIRQIINHVNQCFPLVPAVGKTNDYRPIFSRVLFPLKITRLLVRKSLPSLLLLERTMCIFWYSSSSIYRTTTCQSKWAMTGKHRWFDSLLSVPPLSTWVCAWWLQSKNITRRERAWICTSHNVVTKTQNPLSLLFSGTFIFFCVQGPTLMMAR